MLRHARTRDLLSCRCQTLRGRWWEVGGKRREAGGRRREAEAGRREVGGRGVGWEGRGKRLEVVAEIMTSVITIV
jgi:hypothetical protein